MKDDFEADAPDAQGQMFASATPAPTGTWPVRQDPFSHYRATSTCAATGCADASCLRDLILVQQDSATDEIDG